MKHNLAGAPALLRYNRDSGSVVEAWVWFERFCPWKSDSAFRPAGGSARGPSLGLKLLCDAHASSSVPSTEKCSLEV